MGHGEAASGTQGARGPRVAGVRRLQPEIGKIQHDDIARAELVERVDRVGDVAQPAASYRQHQPVQSRCKLAPQYRLDRLQQAGLVRRIADIFGLAPAS